MTGSGPNTSILKPKFLNVDLEIRSTAKLDALAIDLGKDVIVLYSGPAGKSGQQLLVLESSQCFLKTPEAVIHSLGSALKKLSPASQRIWKRARKRFDVGYELTAKERHSQFSLRAKTLKHLVEWDATLAVTYYRGEESD